MSKFSLDRTWELCLATWKRIAEAEKFLKQTTATIENIKSGPKRKEKRNE